MQSSFVYQAPMPHTRISKKFTLIELVLVIVIIVSLVFFALMTMGREKRQGLTSPFHVGRNFVRMELLCEGGGEYCDSFLMCPIVFNEGFLEELDRPGIDYLYGEMDLEDYIDEDDCSLQQIKGTNLADFHTTLLDIYGYNAFYIVHGMYYDQHFNKMHGPYSIDNNFSIIDGVMYFN